MRLFTMLGEIYDEIMSGENTYIYDEDYECLYLPVSKEFVNHVLGKECHDCGVLIFTLDNDCNYSVDSVIIDEDEQPRDLKEEIAEYVEAHGAEQQYLEMSCVLSNIFCRI